MSDLTKNIKGKGWARYDKSGYEVSSRGDKRFSAFYCFLKDGRSIEEAYQLDVKGYRKKGNTWRVGKGKPPINGITKEQQWKEYKILWLRFLKDNNDLFMELVKIVKSGKVLTDMFATSDINQARALSVIARNYIKRENNGK